MKINYDKEIDAKYICFKKVKVAKTHEKKEWLLFDYDKNGEIIGIEILNATKHPISVLAVEGKFKNFGVVRQTNHSKSRVDSEYMNSFVYNKIYDQNLMKELAFV